MKHKHIKVRYLPAFFRLETVELANFLLILTVSIFSYRAMSLGSMKPNFIKNEKSFKKAPLLKTFIKA